MYKYNTSYLLPIGAGVNVDKLKQFEINHLSSQSREEKKKSVGIPERKFVLRQVFIHHEHSRSMVPFKTWWPSLTDKSQCMEEQPVKPCDQSIDLKHKATCILSSRPSYL